MSAKKGFTLIELIVVMIIVGILAAIALTNYNTMMIQGAAKAAQNNLITIYNAQKTYYFNNGNYCISSCDTLADIDLPANLNLNINDANFNYACAAAGSSYTCTAKNVSNNNFTLTLTGPPNQIVLPGAASPLNPSCQSNNSAYCP